MRLLVVIGAAVVFQLAGAVGGAGAAGQGPTCFDHQATLVGTPGADVLRGTPRLDFIVGLAGNDVIYGLGELDVICGGAGNDNIYGGYGDDNVDGGSGNDRIFGSYGLDNLLGGSGNDRIVGGAGNDSADGGPGADDLFGGAGSDVTGCLRGGPGSDLLDGGPGGDCLVGDAGDDRLLLDEGDDFGFGGPGNDVLVGDAGGDRLHGDEGTDTVAGGDGADFCVGEQKTSCEPLEAGGDLTAGTYTFGGFDPSVTLTVGDGWWSHAGLSYPDFVLIAQGAAVNGSAARFLSFNHVPDQVMDFETGQLVPLEGDFLDWLTSQDCIDLTAGPTPATVAGASGTSVDFSVGTEPVCFERFFWWPGFWFSPGERDRMYVVDADGVDLIIDIATVDAAQFDAFLTEAEAVLDTVEFG